MFDRIVDEVGNRVEQKVSVTRDQHGFLADKAEMRAPFFRCGIEQLHDLARDAGQVHGAERSPLVACLDLRDPCERRERAENAVQLRHRVLDQRLIGSGVTLSIAGSLQLPAYPGQRRA